MNRTTELVIVVRDDLPPGRVATAVAVLASDLGGRLPRPAATDAEDGSRESHAGGNPDAVRVLSATADRLRDLYAAARARQDLIAVALDEDTRVAHGDDNQAVLASPAADHGCPAVAAYGPRERIAALTELLPRYAADAPVTSTSPDGQRRAGLFPAADDRRFTTPATGSERHLLHDVLNAQRDTLRLKCADVETALARRAVPPSTLSLLGLVRHLADVERRWFRQVLAGQHAPPRFSSPVNPDGDFHDAVPEPDVIVAAHRAWQDEIAFADALIAGARDLDVEGHDTWRGSVSLRWVLIHMIEEYARHNGHADLLRERIDGAVGM